MGYTPHRNTLGYWPSGWSSANTKFAGKRICFYTGAHGGNYNTLCDTGNSHEWRRSTAGQYIGCAKKLSGGGSMLLNGGFEAGSNGQIPTDWMRYGNYGSSGVITTEQSHSGSRSIKFYGNSWQLIENGPSAVASTLNLRAGLEYIVTFWARATSYGQNIRSEFLKYPVADGSKSNHQGGLATKSGTSFVKSHRTTSANTWQKFSHSIIPSADTKIVRMNIGPNGVSGTLYLDDVQLVKK